VPNIEDFKLNINIWIDEINNTRSEFIKFMKEHTSQKQLSENEEEITLRETGDTFIYSLSNDIAEILKSIYEMTGIIIKNIPESEWEINNGLSQDVKDLMKRRKVKYSMTTWIEHNELQLVINNKVENTYYVFGGGTFNGHFLSYSQMEYYFQQYLKKKKE
jgi:hypothetical protein